MNSIKRLKKKVVICGEKIVEKIVKSKKIWFNIPMQLFFKIAKQQLCFRHKKLISKFTVSEF